jgi:hypothetical protein
MKPSVTRIRIEVAGTKEQEVHDALLAAAASNRDLHGGEWEIEDGEAEVQSTRDGYWGRVTIRRQDAQRDPLPAR